MGQNDLCQEAAQPGKESFKLGLMGTGVHVHEKVENHHRKQRVGHDVNSKDLVINNKGLKRALFKHIHVNKGMPTAQCYRESSRTFSVHQQDWVPL